MVKALSNRRAAMCREGKRTKGLCNAGRVSGARRIPRVYGARERQSPDWPLK